MERFERSGTVVDPRQSLAMWLRAGRAQRKLSLEEVARITKIQTRILEKLESGRFEGLPADVFVRGFVRSFARCVGLDEGEALERYGECASATARAFVDVLLPPVPVPDPVSAAEPDPVPAAEPDPVPAAEPAAAEPAAAEPVAVAEAPKKRRSRKKASTATGTTPPRTRKKKAAVEDPVIAEGSGEFTPAAPAPEPVAAAVAAAVEPEPVAAAEPVAAETWQPTMPPLPAPTPHPPWRRPALATLVAPSLVIDDEDPDRAEREQEAKLAASAAREASRVSFLPPILLDREDRSENQGGLTLAVIILLIAATLTLSYLMRRPSPSGDGMTMTEMHDTPAHVTLS